MYLLLFLNAGKSCIALVFHTSMLLGRLEISLVISMLHQFSQPNHLPNTLLSVLGTPKIILDLKSICSHLILEFFINIVLVIRRVQSRQEGHGNPTQKPTKYMWQMMISLSIMDSFPKLRAYCGGSGPP